MDFFFYKSLTLFFTLVCAICWVIEYPGCVGAAKSAKCPPPSKAQGGENP
ncbi:MAG: hypothetical protein LBU47_07470 [Christensenellaceae bacterium]|jgi:hypothetical protein|nr:hypothetical protein [Christensenellaceae bacterium]